MNLVLQRHQVSGIGRVTVVQKRAIIKLNAAANFNSNLLPRAAEDSNAPPFCEWPRSCPWPKTEQEVQVPRSHGLGDIFSGEDPLLPPDVEQMALFSDSFADSSHPGRQELNWWTRFSEVWRYQGL